MIRIGYGHAHALRFAICASCTLFATSQLAFARDAAQELLEDGYVRSTGRWLGRVVIERAVKRRGEGARDEGDVDESQEPRIHIYISMSFGPSDGASSEVKRHNGQLFHSSFITDATDAKGSLHLSRP